MNVRTRQPTDELHKHRIVGLTQDCLHSIETFKLLNLIFEYCNIQRLIRIKYIRLCTNTQAYTGKQKQQMYTYKDNTFHILRILVMN